VLVRPCEPGLPCSGAQHASTHSVGSDFIVKALLVREMRFTNPKNLRLTEFSVAGQIECASAEGQAWLRSVLADAGSRPLELTVS